MINDLPNNKLVTSQESDSAVSETTNENTIDPTEPTASDTPVTEAERMYKQGLGDNSHTDKKPA